MEDRVDAAARQLPRRHFFSDMPDKGLFCGVAIAGFAAIMWGKSEGYNADYIMVFAVAAMIGYGVAAYRIPAVRMRSDQLGDNFYYLGFIYTLASLSAALVQLRAGPAIDELLGSFGIALVTTIVGIAGRVLFVQMRGELDDVEERTRRDLAAASSALRGQLGNALQELETFRTAVLQAARETVAQSAETTKAQLGGIASAAQEASKHIEKAFEPNRRHVQKLDESIQHISKGIEQLTERTAAIEFPSERLNKQFASFGQELETLLQRLATTIEGIALRSAGKRQRRWYWPFRR